VKYIALAFLLIVLHGCAGEKYTITTVNEDQLIYCGAGFDSESKARLDAELKTKGGTIDASFQKTLRAAIINVVKELEIPPQDRAKAIQGMYDSYLKCIDARSSKQDDKEKHREGLACRTACCETHDCADDCPMVKVDGYPIPANDGASCKEGERTKWKCVTNNNGKTQCGFRPVIVKYSELRLCIQKCPTR